jgi:hypothetical protein
VSSGILQSSEVPAPLEVRPKLEFMLYAVFRNDHRLSSDLFARDQELSAITNSDFACFSFFESLIVDQRGGLTTLRNDTLELQLFHRIWWQQVPAASLLVRNLYWGGRKKRVASLYGFEYGFRRLHGRGFAVLAGSGSGRNGCLPVGSGACSRTDKGEGQRDSTQNSKATDRR